MTRIVEMKWNCGECSTEGIRGRHKRCPNCGSPREKGEMRMDGLDADDYGSDGYNKAKTVTDAALLDLATAGADWFCTHCDAGNRGDSDRCNGLHGDGCGAPRYGKPQGDHPKFAGDHKKVAIGDDPWEDGYDPEVAGIGEYADEEIDDPTTWDSELGAIAEEVEPEPEPEPEVDWAEVSRKHRSRQATAYITCGVLALTLLIGFIIWAFQTHQEVGRVSNMSWSHATIVERWTDVQVRRWQDDTRIHNEVKPTNGSGERDGMALIGGCREEHHHDEEYQCGTRKESYDCSYNEDYQDTCTRSEEYACGETCRDNGNGFATCATKYCSRSVDYSCTKSRRVSKTCERTVLKYCDRPIYETKCNYRTQEWRTHQTLPASGTGTHTRWPTAEVGPVDRLRFTSDYTVLIAYEDRGKPQTYQHKPTKTRNLWGHPTRLTRREALQAEVLYKKWHPEEAVTVVVNNLGGIREVLHGTETVQAEEGQ